MNKSLLKFIAGGLGLIAIAVGVLYLVNYLRYRTSPEYRAEQYFRDLERRYREDTYGGNTPEETLQLFIDALKKGDVELASRYFVLDEQEKWRKKFSEITNNQLNSFLTDVQTAKLVRKDESNARFEYKRRFEGGVVTIQNSQFTLKAGLVNQPVDIIRGRSGVWKIVSM